MHGVTPDSLNNIILPRCHVACRPGYQANVALFMSPVNYTLDDYLSWAQTDQLNQQQLAHVRVSCW